MPGKQKKVGITDWEKSTCESGTKYYEGKIVMREKLLAGTVFRGKKKM